jgi:HD-GYP domain-containing protein (c-di-GMP phosphodiesterase class II)
MCSSATPVTLLELKDTHVRLNEPLPFGVCDPSGNLLLARGMVVSSAEQLQRLLDRGACLRSEDAPAQIDRQQPAVGRKTNGVSDALLSVQQRLKSLLFEPTAHARFCEEILGCGSDLSRIATTHPDCTLFHLIRTPEREHALYSVTHAIQTAIASHLIAQRLRWSAEERASLVASALTMNVSMTRLQGELAAQTAPPTLAQRQAIHEHPTRSTELLQKLAVRDQDWLRTVLEHHETPDSNGYPRGMACSFEPAEVLRQVDAFMARAIGRVTREAIYPNEAMREHFLASGRSPITAALIKEFGIYPPGTFVRLASTAVAVVLARGEEANKPLVAEIISQHGIFLTCPVARITANPEFAISGIVNSKAVLVPIDPEELYT